MGWQAPGGVASSKPTAESLSSKLSWRKRQPALANGGWVMVTGPTCQFIYSYGKGLYWGQGSDDRTEGYIGEYSPICILWAFGLEGPGKYIHV